MRYLLIGLLKAYRLIVSPLYGNVCRYYPSCSAYALRAVEVHGAVKGSWLAARRLLRCHPWAPGGYDPVPGTPEHAEEARVLAATASGSSPGFPDLGHPDPPVTSPVDAEVADRSAPDHAALSDHAVQSDHAAQPAHVRGVNC